MLDEGSERENLPSLIIYDEIMQKKKDDKLSQKADEAASNNETMDFLYKVLRQPHSAEPHRWHESSFIFPNVFGSCTRETALLEAARTIRPNSSHKVAFTHLTGDPCGRGLLR